MPKGHVRPKQNNAVALGATETTIYTAPSATTTPDAVSRVVHCSVTNYSTSDVTVTLHIVPSGGTAADSNAIEKDMTVPAKSSECPASALHILGAGDVFSGFASAGSAVTVRISVVEFV